MTVAGDVYTKGGVDIYGDIIAGGGLDWQGNTLDGEVYLGDGFSAKKSNTPPSNVHPHYSSLDLSAVSEAADLVPPELTPIDPTITARIDAYSDSNDNAGTDAVDLANGQCTTANPCTITAGTYYFDKLDLHNTPVTFDTRDGPIRIATAGDVTSNGGNTDIDVIGSNRVHIYTGGDVTIKTTWDSEGSRGDQIWIYGSSSSTVDIKGTAEFYGVIYAPGNQDIQVAGSSNVYGALVGSVSKVAGNSAVHYDFVLKNQDPDLVGGGGVPLTYLHISHNEITVENAD